MRLLRPLAATAAAAALILSVLPASARLLIEIDKASQSMTVSRDGRELHRWPVSTGVQRYATPSGTFTPFRMEKDHFSREWDDAPMPHSIFFTKVGHAIHGTNHLRAIGRPASHGCVRLEPRNASMLFDMVKREGMANTRVVLVGETPIAAPEVARAPRAEPQPRYADRPRYIDPRDGDITNAVPPGRGEPVYGEPAYGYPAPPAYRPAPRTGYWVQYPDGRRVFVDRERDPRPLPRPFFFGGN